MPPDKHSAALEEVRQLLLACEESQTPCIAIGAFGSSWNHPGIDQVVQTPNWKKTFQRLCHFGLKVDHSQKLPSSACLVTLSYGVELKSHSCKCDVQNHVMDWLKERCDKQRCEAVHTISIAILKEACPLQNEVTGGTTTSQETPDLHAYVQPDYHVKESVCFEECAIPAEDHQADSSFPTWQKEQQKKKQKENKAKGIEPKKRKFVIEDHYDDCGSDLSGLGLVPDGEPDELPTESLAVFLMTQLGQSKSQHQHVFNTLTEALTYATSKASRLDVIELCGGEARCTQVAIRRKLSAGDNFDIICNCDLNSHENQAKVLEYIKRNRPLVAIMAPTCTPYGPMSNLVKHVAYDAWRRSLANARPHGRFCGTVAILMNELGLYFIAEQPHPSKLWEEPEWEKVMKTSTTVQVVIHQCAAGQKGPEGGYAKKPTRFVANHRTLLEPLTGFVCPGNHEHELLEGGKADFCKLWPWKLATAIVDGIVKLKRLIRTDLSAFPAVGVGPEPPDPKAPAVAPRAEAEAAVCPGCKGHLHRNDPRHTRDPATCRYPFDESISYDCPGCKANRPAAHSSHTYKVGECKHTTIAHRKGVPRKGHHPREPGVPASELPMQDAQAQLPDGSDLVPAPNPGGEASSSSAAPAAPAAAPEARGNELVGPIPAEGEGQLVPVENPGREIVPRGPYRRFVDADAGHEHPADWTRFDITHSLRSLRANHEPTILRTLRKLHLRWWHAGITNMTNVLRNAGVNEEVIRYIPDVINTCRECRKWVPRARETQPSVSIALGFNEVVETDLMFYKEYIVHHFIDRASRWHVAVEVPNKHQETLLTSFQKSWIAIFGPPNLLVTDPENGLNNDSAKARIKRLGTELKVRGKDQHARYIERRGAILRKAMHTFEDQARREGIEINFTELLANCVFVGNAMTHVGGVTPYQVVMGRQPACLPPITDNPGIEERIDSRIREIALQSMISATSATRITRALDTQTTVSGVGRFTPGDMVELYRKPMNKDISGWSGPHEVVDCKAEDGVVTLKIHGQVRPYRIQDVRHAHFVYVSLIGHTSPDVTSNVVEYVHEYISELAEGRLETFGYLNGRLTKASKRWPKISHALDFLTKNTLQMEDISTVRLGRGVHNLPNFELTCQNIVLNWNMNVPDSMSIFVSESPKVPVAKIFGEQHSYTAVMQCFQMDRDLGLTLDDSTGSSSDGGMRSLDLSRPTEVEGSVGRLSPIAEESHVSDATEDVEMLFLQHFSGAPPELVPELKELCYLALNEGVEQLSNEYDALIFYDEPDPMTGETSITAIPDVDTYETDAHGAQYLELYLDKSINVCFCENEVELPPNKILVYLNAEAKKEVIDRDTDLLTKDEMTTHNDLVEKATLAEFQTWEKYRCFERIAKSDTKVLIDAKLVIKWKYVDGQRTIRVRMALRGFKEPLDDNEVTFSATAQRISQKILASEAACHPEWSFVAVDISKAFLQGLTFQEMHEITGEPEKNIAFTVPKGTAHLLRRIPGYENFNEREEALRCLKPGTGCRDAPRAFNLRLTRLMKEYGLVPTMHDPQLMMLHKDGQLILITTIHVDDLKIAGLSHEIKNLIKILEEKFGKLTYNENKFTNCGITHERKPDGSIVMDQDEYIKAFKPIHPKHYNHLPKDSECSAHLQALYWSLLGAVAYSGLTQAWVLVYIISLQRATQRPTVAHIKRLNALTRELQRRPQKLVYNCMKCSNLLQLYSDSSFSREGDKGYALRGAVFLRVGQSVQGNRCVHLIDAVSQSHKLVVRSTFAAELLALTASVDQGFIILITLHEFRGGSMKPHMGVALRETGGYLIEFEVLIDAKSVHSAVGNENFKHPAEKSLLSHIAWIKQLLNVRIISRFGWTDTRDMIADGMTKGSIDRAVLIKCMLGQTESSYPIEFINPSSKQWTTVCAKG